jgi:hypothetical protein
MTKHEDTTQSAGSWRASRTPRLAAWSSGLITESRITLKLNRPKGLHRSNDDH